MFLTTALFSVALANDGPTPRLYAEANGSAVTLSIELHSAGEPGLGEDLDILRLEGETETAVVEGRSWSSGEADYTTQHCKNWEVGTTDTGVWWSCDDQPDRCEDCDGDGVNECRYGCVDWPGFLVEDACVEAGEVRYEVRETGETYDVAAAELTVEDVGQDCEEVGDTGDGSDDDDGGLFACSVTPSVKARQALLGFAMGLVGLIALRRRD